MLYTCYNSATGLKYYNRVLAKISRRQHCEKISGEKKLYIVKSQHAAKFVELFGYKRVIFILFGIVKVARARLHDRLV
jgi:hypothetical protein